MFSGMTLTQVSTWFANARRRLKKENGLKEDTDESIDDKGLKMIRWSWVRVLSIATFF